MALLGHNDQMLSRRLGGDAFGAEGGRMGDYVFSQDGTQFRRCSKRFLTAIPALDQIITQIMENSNANRPVPASDEAINDLQRDVLLEGCVFCSILDCDGL